MTQTETITAERAARVDLPKLDDRAMRGSNLMRRSFAAIVRSASRDLSADGTSSTSNSSKFE